MILVFASSACLGYKPRTRAISRSFYFWVFWVVLKIDKMFHIGDLWKSKNHDALRTSVNSVV